VNFVGHIKVALDQAPDGAIPTGVLVGAALPDVAAMGRHRLVDRAADTDVNAGIALHHQTDDAFHRHPWFRANSQAVTGSLEAIGLPRGAARACGHVGVELLLDGLLLDTDDRLAEATRQAMGAVTTPAYKIEDMVTAERRDDWRRHLRRTADWPLPRDYREPVAVAERLRRILDRRPRLRFDADQTERVAAILADRQAVLEQDAEALLADLRQQVGVQPPAQS